MVGAGGERSYPRNFVLEQLLSRAQQEWKNERYQYESTGEAEEDEADQATEKSLKAPASWGTADKEFSLDSETAKQCKRRAKDDAMQYLIYFRNLALTATSKKPTYLSSSVGEPAGNNKEIL
jgi:hypothetical protein